MNLQHQHLCVCVQLEEGKLWLQLTCSTAGNADMLGLSGRRINDGSWHTVVLELTRNYSSLALDDSYTERRHISSVLPVLSMDRSIYFGALVSS